MQARWLKQNWGFIFSAIGFVYFSFFPILYLPFLGDPHVDYGPELYLFWRLSEGARLYLDFDYLYGPLPVLLSKSIYSLWERGGVVALNTIASLGLLAFLQVFLGRFVSRGVAGLAVFFTVFFFATNQIVYGQNYNFFTPYKSGALYGLLFSSLAFLLAAWSVLSGSKNARAWFFGSGLAGAACFLSKQEHTLALFLSMAVPFAYFFFTRKGAGRFTELLAFSAGFLLALAAMVIYFSASTGAPLGQAFGLIFKPYLVLFSTGIVGQNFYSSMSGIGSGASILRSAGFILLLGGTGGLAYAFATRANLAAQSAGAILLLLLPCLAILSDPAFFLFVESLSVYASLPLFSLLVIFFVAYQNRKTKEPKKETVVFLSGAVFSAALCLKTFFQFRIAQYGFCLGPPAMVLLLVSLHYACAELKKRKGERVAFAFALLLLTVGLGQAATLVGVSMRMRTERPISLTVRGTSFRTSQITALAFYHFSDELKSILTNPQDTLTVLPEGNFFNWVIQRKSPLRFLSLYPDQFVVNSEARILEQMENQPSDYIAFFPRDLSEYGFGSFQDTYGKNVFQWIQQRYVRLVPSEKHKDALERFEVSIWKRAERGGISPNPSTRR